MEHLQPKTGNPLVFFFLSILLISCPPLLFWITKIFCNTKTFKFTTKVDADSTYYVMSLNENEQEPGSIIKDSDVTDDQ